MVYETVYILIGIGAYKAVGDGDESQHQAGVTLIQDLHALHGASRQYHKHRNPEVPAQGFAVQGYQFLCVFLFDSVHISTVLMVSGI